jgi:hypothetical protein
MNELVRASMSESISRPSLNAVVSGTGIIIRYSFYLVGALVLGMIGLAMLTFYGGRTRTVDERPAFRLAAQHLSALTMRSQIVTGGQFGRLELIQYGALHDRGVNLNIGMGFPPADALITRDSMPQLSSLMPRNRRTVLSSTHYDLETRFGPARATDLRIESDGQWKQCLAFASRFDTTAVYLMGWYCDASGAKPSAASLACMLDRLTLDRPLASKEADAFMRERLVRPASCSAIPVSQTIDTRQRSRMSTPQRWSTPSAQQRY